MKIKKIIAGLSAMAIASAMSLSALAADEPDNNTITIRSTDSQSGSTNVTYNAAPTYIVTIPASVTLDSENTVTANIAASQIILESGQKIKVSLTEASNTESGSSFSAKNEAGNSTATYTISKGETAVAVGDVVAEFNANGEQALTFSAASGTTFAGTHTERLTFTISVEDAAAANPYAANVVGDVVTFGNYDWYIIGKSDNGVTLLMKEYFGKKKYNDAWAAITWETCTLRTYLNGEFYNSFSAEDKAKIALTHNTNLDNPEYGTDGGNETDDYIYLLSIAEANALSDTIRANSSGSWWLRSPGDYSYYAAFVDGDDGDVDLNGHDGDGEYGVRPALNLEF